MKLSDFSGKRMMLYAVDFWSNSKNEYEDANICNFRLDGVVYSAIEDPDDGYRSFMEDLEVNENNAVLNTFEPVEVICRHRANCNGYEGEVSDVLELIDIVTGKIILEVGTENTDDYYPYYISIFTPENMAVNNK